MPSAKASTAPQRLRITQVRSGIGRPAKHRATLKALGIRRHQHSVIHDDTPSIRGMVFRVRHLIRVDELAEGEA